jgi:EAL domain-containing protein (putative c-di-GMP-specific phosphodiesterase class I)
LQKLAEPFRLGDDVAYVSASIGITLYPDDATDIDILLKNADQAMYTAKDQGRNRYQYFTASMQETAQAKKRLTIDLRDAVANSEFILYYQPIIELATGAIYKAEALIRWQHPTRGLVSPVEFIPIAEETGMINDIGNWVFTEAAKQVKIWRTSHHAAFQISVNKSPVQFHATGSTHVDWIDYLRQLDLPGQSIAVEITEGLLLQARTTVTEQLLEFRNAGMQISIDDFGTGYSSLSYLKKFDIDYVKIDQSFTGNLKPGSSDMVLCEAIIVMAHKLGMKVIAEGVETEGQRDLLLAAGCDYGQGYLYSKPVPAAEFEKLLKAASRN